MTVSARQSDLHRQPAETRPNRGLPRDDVDRTSQRKEPTASQPLSIARSLFILISLATVAIGWWLAQHEVLTPEDGAGYWIGIAGGTVLLAQLAYPLRKRARFMRRLGSAPAWFRLHMALGIIGPLLILYHSNYSL